MYLHLHPKASAHMIPEAEKSHSLPPQAANPGKLMEHFSWSLVARDPEETPIRTQVGGWRGCDVWPQLKQRSS